MIKFKFFHKNPHRDKCRLQVGSSFIFKGNYCTVKSMGMDGFSYNDQSKPNSGCYMTYKFYLQTQSAAGRKLNR